mgnify:CR=1 FL=1
MADSKIIIDAKINTAQATKELGALRKTAGSTAAAIRKTSGKGRGSSEAQQAAAAERAARAEERLATATQKYQAAQAGRDAMARQLDEAKAKAEDLEAQLNAVEQKLLEATAREKEAQKGIRGIDTISPSLRQTSARHSAILNNDDLVSESNRLSKELNAQDAVVSKLELKLAALQTKTDGAAQAQQRAAQAAEQANAALETQSIKSRIASEIALALTQSKAGRALLAVMKLAGAFGSVAGGAVSLGKRAAGALGGLAKKLKKLTGKLRQGNKFTRAFSGRLRRLAVGVLAFNALSSAVQALAKNAEYRQSLANLKGASGLAASGLAALLAPALAKLANLAATALYYFARLFSLLTGKGLAGLRSTAKGFNGVGSSAQKAADAVMGFDELNVLQGGDTGSSGSGGEDIAPNYDFAAQNGLLDSVLAAIQAGDWAGAAKLLADKLNSLVEAWDAYDWGLSLGRKLQNGITFLYTFITTANWNQIGRKLAECVNGILEPIDGYQLGAVLASRFSIAIRMLGDFLANLDWGQLAAKFSDFGRGFLDAISEAIQSVDWTQIGRNVVDCLTNIDWVGLLLSVGTLGASILDAIEQFITGIIDQAKRWLGDKLQDVGTYTVQGFLLGMLSELVNIADWINEHLFQPIVDAICDLFGIHSPSTVAYDWGTYIMEGLKNGLSSMFPDISDKLSELLQLFRQHWENLKQNTSEAWQGIADGIKQAINGILAAVNGMLQGMVSGINGAIDALNKLSFTIPDWVPAFGGKHWGLNLPRVTAPQIPYLAQGAVIPANREFLAVLGDQKHGTNVEAPLETIKQALAEVMAQDDREISVTVNTRLDGDVLYRASERAKARRGLTMVLNPSFT